MRPIKGLAEFDGCDLISLRKAMQADLEESLGSAVASFRATLAAIADAGARAYPPAGESLKNGLLGLHQFLAGTPSPTAFEQAEQAAGRELKSWSEGAARHYEDSTREVKSLLLVVAKAAADMGERDQRQGSRFRDLAGQLEGAAKLESVVQMRQVLSASATELVTCVDRMAEDSKRSLDQLRAQVSSYQARVEQAERLAALDPLTGVSNRRVIERQLEDRVARAAPFCVVYLDLDGFKRINDTFGHLAGDDILRQFASELRQSLRPVDTVGRYGGDEFIVLIDGSLEEAAQRIERVRKWVTGEYTVSTDRGQQKVKVGAAIGVAMWQAGRSAKDLLRAADGAMYGAKAKPR